MKGNTVVNDPTAIRGPTHVMDALEMACQLNGAWQELMVVHMSQKHGGAMRFDYANSNFSTIYRAWHIWPSQHVAWLKVCECAVKLGLRVTEGRPRRKGKIAHKLGYPRY